MVVVKILVVDTGGFLRLNKFDFHKYEKVYTLPSVLNEVKEIQIKQNILDTSDSLIVATPTSADISFVEQFAKATGDFGFLSLTDIHVVALTYMLQRLSGDVESLKSIQEWRQNIKLNIVQHKDGLLSGKSIDNSWFPKEDNETSKDKDDDNDASTVNNDDSDQSYDSNNESDMDDDEGWIDKNNFEKLQVTYRNAGSMLEKDITVACITTDKSIQNLLLHMGLIALSINGIKIEELAIWARRCQGCWTIILDTERLFCPECGNSILSKIKLINNSDGTMSVVKNKWFPRYRGKIYSLPMPKGGREGHLILCEDDIYRGGRDKQYRYARNLYNKERLANNPLNEDLTTDKIYNTRFTQNQQFKPLKVGLGPGNPNSNRWQKKNRSKKK